MTIHHTDHTILTSCSGESAHVPNLWQDILSDPCNGQSMISAFGAILCFYCRMGSRKKEFCVSWSSWMLKVAGKCWPDRFFLNFFILLSSPRATIRIAKYFHTILFLNSIYATLYQMNVQCLIDISGGLKEILSFSLTYIVDLQICRLYVCNQPQTTLRIFLCDCAGRVSVKTGRYSTRPIRDSWTPPSLQVSVKETKQGRARGWI